MKVLRDFVSHLKNFFKKEKEPKVRKRKPKTKIVPEQKSIEPKFVEDIRPISGHAFLKSLGIEKKKIKREEKQESEAPKDTREEKQKINGKLLFMEEKGGVITALAKKGRIEFNKNSFLGRARGEDIPRWIAKESKRAGIRGIKANGFEVTASPEAQQQLQKTLF